MKKFISLAAAAALTLSSIPSTLGLMADQVLKKDSALYKSITVRGKQMTKPERSGMKKQLKHRITARSARMTKLAQDKLKPVRVIPVRGYFVPKSSVSSASSTSSTSSTSSAGSTSSATSSATSSH